MDETSADPDEYKELGLTPEEGRDEEKIKEILRKKETDENIKKLGEQLAREWANDEEPTDNQSLSFAEFAEKLERVQASLTQKMD